MTNGTLLTVMADQCELYTLVSALPWRHFKSSLTRLFVQQRIQANIEEKITASHYFINGLLWGNYMNLAWQWCNMSVTASQITSRSSVCSIVYSGQRKISKVRITGQLWKESTGDRWTPLTKGQLWGKRFHIMTSSGQVFSVPIPHKLSEYGPRCDYRYPTI